VDSALVTRLSHANHWFESEGVGNPCQVPWFSDRFEPKLVEPDIDGKDKKDVGACIDCEVTADQ